MNNHQNAIFHQLDNFMQHSNPTFLPLVRISVLGYLLLSLSQTGVFARAIALFSSISE
jgi:hypothetical protein